MNNTKIAGLIAFLLVAGMLGSAPALAATGPVIINTVDADYNPIVANSITVTGPENHSFNDLSQVTLTLPNGEYVIAAEYGELTEDRSITVDNLTNSQPYFLIFDVSVDQEPNTSFDLIKEVDFEDEVKPGDEVEFEITLRNTNFGFDAEEVELTVTIEGIDDNDDIDATEDVGKVREGRKKQEETTDLTIPTIAEEGDYTVLVEVDWEYEDANGDMQDMYSSYEDTITVEKEDHDVIVENFMLSKTAISAGKTIEASVNVANIGLEDEQVRIKVHNAELGIEETTAIFDLDEEKSTTQYLSFVVPSDAAPGKYFITTTAYFDDGSDNTIDTTVLEIKEDTQPEFQDDATITLTPIVTTVPTEDAPELDVDLTSAGIIAAILVLLGFIVVIGKDLIPARR